MAPNLRPVSSSSGVGGVLGAPTSPAIEELVGISEGAATKSYTQILFGRARPGLVIGVCSVTLVEAHPAIINRTSRPGRMRNLDLITILQFFNGSPSELLSSRETRITR